MILMGDLPFSKQKVNLGEVDFGRKKGYGGGLGREKGWKTLAAIWNK